MGTLVSAPTGVFLTRQSGLLHKFLLLTGGDPPPRFARSGQAIGRSTNDWCDQLGC